MDVWEILSKVYLHDFEIIKYHSKRKDFVNLIKKKLSEVIWKKMIKFQETTPPFILEKSKFVINDRKTYVKKVSNVKYVEMKVTDRNFIVYINKDLPNTWQRTFIGHELGHTFLYNLEKYPIEPYIVSESYKNLFNNRLSNIYSSKFDETFAYDIARILLIPERVLREYISETPSIDSFLVACKRFLTTNDIMARRLFWDIYDWEHKTSYWKNTFLILIPIEGKVEDFSIDYKIFKGNYFRNYNYKKIKKLIRFLITDALKYPGKTLLFNNYKENCNWFTPLIYKGSRIDLEFKYIESKKSKKLYILGNRLKNE